MPKTMAKKTAPVKAKAKTPPAKGATKKVAASAKGMKKAAPAAKPVPKAAVKHPAKPAAKVAPKPATVAATAKNLKAKAPLKSDPKKDVKSLASTKLLAGAKAGKTEVTPSDVNDAKGLNGAKGAKNAKGAKAAAAVPAPVVQKPLTKPAKVAKGKGVKAPRAPKNYENMCREISCESSSSTSGYCRLHYIKNWKKIKRKELILREKKLNQYIEELVSKYPDKYIEAIKGDLSDEQAFSKVIFDLELDENVDEIPGDDEADESIIDNIKREFDDGDTDF